MCAVSAITPILNQQWPQPSQLGYSDAVSLAEIIRRLDILDNKLGAIKCGPDAAKDKYIRELTLRIVELEFAQQHGEGARQKKTPQRDSRGAKGKR